MKQTRRMFSKAVRWLFFEKVHSERIAITRGYDIPRSYQLQVIQQVIDLKAELDVTSPCLECLRVNIRSRHLLVHAVVFVLCSPEGKSVSHQTQDFKPEDSFGVR